ncbi:helix-turn-helix domain-containing protein [Desulfobacula sp.]|uniref:helix-turn-helix domain-containing protein n=1 Tax=Desulfobacula sp. TaxID=2593537 RepID=UPI002637ACF1|nr:helix-turn-helix domain-containing protein [Desulfobacula sp.]
MIKKVSKIPKVKNIIAPLIQDMLCLDQGRSVYPDIQPISKIARRQIAVTLINKGYAFNAAARLVGCSVSTVARSIKRMNIIGDLTDASRSGRPAIYSETFKLELTGSLSIKLMGQTMF